MIVMCMLGMSLLFAVYASIRVNRLEERVEHLEKSRLKTERPCRRLCDAALPSDEKFSKTLTENQGQSHP